MSKSEKQKSSMETYQSLTCSIKTLVPIMRQQLPITRNPYSINIPSVYTSRGTKIGDLRH